MKVDLIAREAAALYESGMSIEQVAAKLGVAYRTARKAIRMAGVENRGPSERLIGRTRPDKAAERAEKAVYDDPSQQPFVYSEAGAEQIAALLSEPLVGDPWMSGDEQMETSLSSVSR